MTRSELRVDYSPWPLLMASLVAITFAVLGYVRYAPPPIEAPSAAAQDYSIERVMSILDTLVGDGIPHPSGSPQNLVVRQRIIDFVEKLGRTVELQETSGVTWITKETIPVVNLLILIPGSDPVATIALASHYDSTAAGPGAADDGAAVAISLELLRHYHLHPPKNNLLFLITDGEELGLLGAAKFVQEHPLAATVDLLINLEARGTSGPSCMFETSDASRWTLEQYSAVAQRPTTSSLFFEIYKLLPNNTDFTHYRKLPIQGWNFAFVGQVLNYHTPNDRLANVDRRSINHHAQHASSLVARFANTAELDIEPGRAVYFDYLGWWIFMWDEALAVPLATLPSVLVVLAFVLAWRRGELTFFRLAMAVLWLLSMGVCVTFGLWATFETMRFQDLFSPPWPKHPVPILLAFWTVAIGIGVALARLGYGLATEIFYFLAFVATALAWLTAAYLPGASYLFLLPAIGWGVAGFCRGRTGQLAAILAWFSVVAVWFPLEPLFYDALGFGSREILLGRQLLFAFALAPVCLSSWQVRNPDSTSS